MMSKYQEYSGENSGRKLKKNTIWKCVKVHINLTKSCLHDKRDYFWALECLNDALIRACDSYSEFAAKILFDLILLSLYLAEKKGYQTKIQ